MGLDSYSSANKIEQEGLEVIIPYLKTKATDGQFVTTSKGRLSKFLQQSVGDFLFNSNNKVYSIELKVEKEKKYGNFFLEVWSNMDFERRNVGWMYKVDCDYIWYYFIDCDELYSINYKELWIWFFKEGNSNRFKERVQSKYSQLNTTTGRCVPISVIVDEVKGTKLIFPKNELGYTSTSTG